MANSSSNIIWDKDTRKSLFALIQEVNKINSSMASRIISINEDWKNRIEQFSGGAFQKTYREILSNPAYIATLNSFPIARLEDNFEFNLYADSGSSKSDIDSSDGFVEKDIESSSSNSALRQRNQYLLDQFNKGNAKFKYILHHTDFEDGYLNEATEMFEEYYKEDPCISLFWMSGFYSDNLDDKVVIEGLLRILSGLEIQEYRKYVIPLVKASFNDVDPAVQEAAIMVAENWRNEMCLTALRQTEFSSPWIREYANKVIEELSEELSQ